MIELDLHDITLAVHDWGGDAPQRIGGYISDFMAANP
jgi:hypothetical protein